MEYPEIPIFSISRIKDDEKGIEFFSGVVQRALKCDLEVAQDIIHDLNNWIDDEFYKRYHKTSLQRYLDPGPLFDFYVELSKQNIPIDIIANYYC